ncbi:ester cyclase [Sphingobium aromaticiconvertens]|uniref:ester cyclase n=1 Tax=Sphingobium aromaticiconvertens TaxID=365341 RepID=UPI00301798E3
MAWKEPIREQLDVSDSTLLTDQQKKMVKHWTDLQEVLNAGDFEGMDRFFHPDFRYGNPNRPDLGTYDQWKTSPVALYKTFYPAAYKTIDAVGKGEDEIWIYATHYCKHVGGPYMGVQPTGNEFQVNWFSIVKFQDDKIVNIFSISDVLTMLKDIGVVDVPQPVDPYK